MCIRQPLIAIMDTSAVSLVSSEDSINRNERRLETQIQDILEAIDATEQFVAGMSFNQFSQDQKTIFAIERSLGIIGATAKRLPINLRDQYTEIAWRDITCFSDQITYGFFEVDLALLWRIAQQDVPKLKTLMIMLLEKLASDIA